LGVAMLVWWRWRPFRVEVEGDSMAPTLRPGEYLVAVRSHRVVGGSLVVVEHPGRPGYEMVKRVAATPGERVADRVLGPDEYWVVGDNEDGSTDSRTFGPLSAEALRGRVVFRYWPLRNLMDLLPAMTRPRKAWWPSGASGRSGRWRSP
jgi:nickel-type superoxide dismutase maturation protease